jgi:hypothetical protein
MPHICFCYSFKRTLHDSRFFYRVRFEIELKTIFTSFGDIFGGMRKITNLINVMIKNT